MINYKANGFQGAVLCRKCRVIIDKKISYEDAVAKWEGRDVCEDCATKCAKCGGTGWYAYDHNHSQVCDACCKHDAGWWELTEAFVGYEAGADNRCCKAGCGTMYRDVTTEGVTK